MSENTWIVVAGDPAIGGLIETARPLGGQLAVAVVGPRAVAETVAAGGVDKVIWFGEPGQVPVEAYATAVAEAVAAAPGVVFGARRASDRVLLGAVAARLQAPVLTGASSVTAEGDDLVVARSLFGGISVETVSVSGPVAIMLDGGPVPAAAGAAVSVEEIEATPLGMTVLETESTEAEQVDLGAAHRVVSVGRGLKAKADLALIAALGAAAKAEVACSRPLAEGVDWVSKERYVGLSGQHIAPEVYFAIGISGQLQHMVGVRGAHTIVAINSDANAPVFEEADYCLVGDLYKLVPAITDALK